MKKYIVNKFLGDAKEYKPAPVPAPANKPAPAYKPLAPVYNKPVVTYKPSDSYNPAPAYKPTYKPGMYIRKLPNNFKIDKVKSKNSHSI